jgi:hypothetical protein
MPHIPTHTMISKFMDMQRSDDTLEIIMTGWLGVLECDTFPAHYDF